ncbi:hypothetical protein B0H13DRAFT_2539847 [Mycena leptocephala]|nr:hypothetical protein B0H13DRAFT_2539847 [Mycena leptocephala]
MSASPTSLGVGTPFASSASSSPMPTPARLWSDFSSVPASTATSSPAPEDDGEMKRDPEAADELTSALIWWTSSASADISIAGRSHFEVTYIEDGETVHWGAAVKSKDPNKIKKPFKMCSLFNTESPGDDNSDFDKASAWPGVIDFEKPAVFSVSGRPQPTWGDSLLLVTSILLGFLYKLGSMKGDKRKLSEQRPTWSPGGYEPIENEVFTSRATVKSFLKSYFISFQVARSGTAVGGPLQKTSPGDPHPVNIPFKRIAR